MATTCRAYNSMDVLDHLVRTGLWSKPDSLLKFRKVVLDVDSVVLSLHRLCVANHLRRHFSINRSKPDLYSATLVNYTEFALLVKQLIDSLQDHNIESVLVYGGKPMEAPLFGLLAAEFTKNTQKVVEPISIVNDYDKHGYDGYTGADPRYGHKLGRPDLALIIFKSIINIKRRAGAKIHVFQAFYSPYPLMAKMARDFDCPVITDNGDFIIMDVRAGFILFEEFWFHYVDKHNLEAKSDTSGASKQHSSESSKARTRKNSTTGASDINFHYNYLFLHQHPGFKAQLAIYLCPLTTVDFVTKFGDSLKRLKVYDTAYNEKDFVPSSRVDAKLMYKKHHMAANRLEMALTFLASKSVDTIGNLIRSEATRTNTSFDDDFRNLFNFHAVAFEFRQRLRFVLNYVYDPIQLNYIEWCLINRECTSDYLLDLLCCSIGRLACVSYNKNLQFEDFTTKHSAYKLKNRSKSMLMSLFTANKSHKSEHSISLSKKQQDTVTRYSTASLIIVDRQRRKPAESTLETIHENNQLDAIRDKLQLSALSHRKVAKSDRAKFINLAFNATDISRMDPKFEASILKHLGRDEHSIRNELAIVRSLFIYSYQSASAEDNHFKNSYSNLVRQFEIAIVNHYLHMNEKLSKQKQGGTLAALVNLINKQDFENVANYNLAPSSGTGSEIQSVSGTKSPKNLSAKSKKNSTLAAKSLKQASAKSNIDASKQVRHLIELLGASIEAYCELNAFFDYPLPRLNLALHYNPILLYNLTFQTGNKALMKF